MTSMLTMSPFCSRLSDGNAVADHMVDRGADRLGKAAIVERGGDRLMIENVVVTELVELIRRDARLDVRRDEVEGLGGQRGRHGACLRTLQGRAA